MLFDRLADASRYANLSPRLAAGFAWLQGRDWSQVADGRHVIDGEDLFAIVEGGTTFDPAVRRYESHRTYLDIQLSLEGGERIGWCPALAMPAGNQEGPDIWFHAEPEYGQLLTVIPGWFAVFLPGEGHKPCCRLAELGRPFRKCVVKVKWG
jgi:biofilm protein TabA